MCYASRIDGSDYYVSSGDQPTISLSRKPVIKYSISVTVNNVTQVENIDYVSDSDGGTVKFLRPLSKSDMVSITYVYDSGKATIVSSALASPYSVGLVSQGNTSLNANFSSQGASAGSNMSAGLSGAWKTNGGPSFTGSVGYVPAATADAPTMVKTNLAGDYTHQFGSTNLTAQSSFASLTGSNQNMQNSLAMKTNMNQWLSLIGSYKLTNVVDSSGNATNSNNSQFGLNINSLKPNKYLAINGVLTRSEAGSTTSSMAATDNMDLNAAYTPSKTLNMQARTIETVNNDITTRTNSLASTFTGSNSAKITANISTSTTGSETTPDATTQSSSVTGSISPYKQLAVAVNTSQQISPSGVLRSDSISSTLMQPHSTKFIASLSKNQDTSGVITQVKDLNLSTVPASNLTVAGDYKTRDIITCGISTPGLNTLNTQATIKVSKPFLITGIYAEHPDDSGSPLEIFRRALNISSQVGSLKLTTNYTVETPTDSTTNPTEKVGLTGALGISSVTTISGGFSDSNILGYADRVRNYTFGVTHNLGDAFKLSLSGGVNVEDDITPTTTTNAAASIGMKF